MSIINLLMIMLSRSKHDIRSVPHFVLPRSSHIRASTKCVRTFDPDIMIIQVTDIY